MHLSQFAHRLPSQLSGGQRQRMALARALAVEPTVLLLDEPFGALDAKVRKELRDWLRRLHDEVHVTTVFVTHDQEEALEVADEIVVINDGRIEQIGAPDELYDEPANDFVMSFLGPVTDARRPAGAAARHRRVTRRARPRARLPGEVTRMLRVGFEVRLTVRPLSSVRPSRPGRGRGPGRGGGGLGGAHPLARPRARPRSRQPGLGLRERRRPHRPVDAARRLLTPRPLC